MIIPAFIAYSNHKSFICHPTISRLVKVHQNKNQYHLPIAGDDFRFYKPGYGLGYSIVCISRVMGWVADHMQGI